MLCARHAKRCAYVISFNPLKNPVRCPTMLTISILQIRNPRDVNSLFAFFFFFFIATLFIYFFICGCVGSSVRARAFSSYGKWGPLFIAVQGPLFIAVRGSLTIAAPPVAGHRLQTRRLSSCGSRAQPLLPDQGSNPCPLH